MKFRKRGKHARKRRRAAPAETTAELTKEMRVVKRKVKQMEIPLDNYYDLTVSGQQITLPLNGNLATGLMGTAFGTYFPDMLGGINIQSATVAAGGGAQTIGVTKLGRRMGSKITLKKIRFVYDVVNLPSAHDYNNIRVIMFQMRRPNGTPSTSRGSTLPRWCDVMRVYENTPGLVTLQGGNIFDGKTPYTPENINIIYDKVHLCTPANSSTMGSVQPFWANDRYIHHGEFTYHFPKAWAEVIYNEVSSQSYCDIIEQNALYTIFFNDDQDNSSYFTARCELDYDG